MFDAGHRAAESSRVLLGLDGARRRFLLWLIVHVVLLVVTVILAIGVGPVVVSPSAVMRIVGSSLVGLGLDAENAQHVAIVWEIRTPRVVLGAAVGSGLALAGVALQALVRNVLADPYILGVNSGASCGAAAAILFGAGAAFGDYAVQGSAFVGAVLATVLVFFTARANGRMTSIRLLMSGVAVGYALSAGTSFLIFASDSAESARSVMFWLLGSLGLAAWNGALVVVVVVVVAVGLFLWLMAQQLDAVNAGDETAMTLGINPDRLRLVIMLAVCLLVGAVVAMAGSIGFVGLVVPHLSRRLVGASHRFVIPIAALGGALLLVAADIAARTLLAPQELSIGIITALVGAPFLLLLVKRMVPHA